MCKHSEIADLTGMWGLSEKWSSRARRGQPGQTVRVSGGGGVLGLSLDRLTQDSGLALKVGSSYIYRKYRNYSKGKKMSCQIHVPA